MPLSRRSFLYCLNCLSAGALASPFPWQTAPADIRRGMDQGLPIKLNRNENAYGPSATVRAAMQASLELSNRYPDTDCQAAVQEIASFHGLGRGNLLLGCGSTDIMRMCAQAFLTPGTK